MNPVAGGVTAAVQRVVVAALESRFKLDASETDSRGAAIAISRGAAEEGCDFIVAFGGDGLINEVVNGMAGGATRLAVIPGGTMNVFARNLGIPRDPLEATDRILQGAGERPTAGVHLGGLNDRLFAFACGCGFDAEAARRVEERRATKRRFGEPYFYTTAVGTFLRSYAGRAPFLRCEGAFGTEEAVMVAACTGGPYAYLLGRPVRLGRGSRDGLDLFILRRLRYLHLPRYAIGAAFGGDFGPEARMESEVGAVDVSGAAAFAVHADGEPLPSVEGARISSRVARVEVLV
jgi:diacylglycerol kinase family enzyme